jgi:hypothetical protein
MRARKEGAPLAARATLNHKLSVVLLKTIAIPKHHNNYNKNPATKLAQQQYSVLSDSSSSTFFAESLPVFLPAIGGEGGGASVTERRRRSDAVFEDTGRVISSDLTLLIGMERLALDKDAGGGEGS